MNHESTAETAIQPAPLSQPRPVEASQAKPESDAVPFFFVPRPPIPGKTAWSAAPW
ncbi:hypothetical protein [Methylomagnum sp.]